MDYAGVKGVWLVGEAEPLGRSHVPEPRAGSLFACDGQRADLFNVRHYPVRAICRICDEVIRAESFFRPFGHVEVPLAVVYQFPYGDSAEAARRS